MIGTSSEIARFFFCIVLVPRVATLNQRSESRLVSIKDVGARLQCPFVYWYLAMQLKRVEFSGICCTEPRVSIVLKLEYTQDDFYFTDILKARKLHYRIYSQYWCGLPCVALRTRMVLPYTVVKIIVGEYSLVHISIFLVWHYAIAPTTSSAVLAPDENRRDRSTQTMQ